MGKMLVIRMNKNLTMVFRMPPLQIAKKKKKIIDVILLVLPSGVSPETIEEPSNRKHG